MPRADVAVVDIDIADTYHLIPPSGPPDADGLLVGEAGGQTEHFRRRPFCGKAGQVMNTYLEAARLPRSTVRVTNVFNFWPGPSNPEPTPAQIRQEEWRLVEELKLVRPKVIGAVGRVALNWFLPGGDVSAHHGLPHPFSICFSCGAIGHEQNQVGDDGKTTIADSKDEDVLDLDWSKDQRVWSRKTLRNEPPCPSCGVGTDQPQACSCASGGRPSVLQQSMRKPESYRVRHRRGERAPRVSTDGRVSKRPPQNPGEHSNSSQGGRSHGQVLPGMRTRIGSQQASIQDPVAPSLRAEERRPNKRIQQESVSSRRSISQAQEACVASVPSGSPRRNQCCATPEIFQTIVVGIYHPAAGFYNPDLAAFSQDDFFQFAYYLKNPVDVRRAPKIRVVEVKLPPGETLTIRDAAVDTEGDEEEPWGLSWSFDGRTTYVYVYEPGRKIRLRGFIMFQNALHDLKILRAMGVDTSAEAFEYGDTMVRLYNLRLEPQGLKPAAYRHLGLVMYDFESVVRPHFDVQALAYLREAVRFKYPKPDPEPLEDYAKRKWRLYKPWDAKRRIKAVLTSWAKGGGKTKKGEPIKLEKKWADLGEDFQTQIRMRMKRLPFPSFSIFRVPRKQAVHYSGIDAAATKLLDQKLIPLITAKKLEKVYEMDRRYLPFVDKMQETGMRVDVPLLRDLELHLEEVREVARGKVQKLVGDRWFNPGSDDQVGRWLYRVRGIPIMKYTKGGVSGEGVGSTSAVTMKMIQGYHKEDLEVVEFTKLIREYRESDKYLGTFVQPIFSYMRQDKRGNWRIHPNFRVTRVVSGRNSSHEPNVMALPTRTALGNRIRSCFVAEDGYLIIAVDASQIELRTMAHHCQDPRMMRAFEMNEDLHALTASLIFNVSLNKVTKIQRYVAKTINFAVMYGISAKALLEQMYKADIFDFSLEDCRRFIDEWFRIYGSVRKFLQRVWYQAERDGFVRDMWGRMAYVPNLRIQDQQMREAAQRLAGNMPIQGGARGLVKRAQTRVHDYLVEMGHYKDESVRPWLDLHDEVDMEVREDLAQDILKTTVKFFQADQHLFRVPIKAEGGVGKSWAEAKAA